jgi:hypothetical protein
MAAAVAAAAPKVDMEAVAVAQLSDWELMQQI